MPEESILDLDDFVRSIALRDHERLISIQHVLQFDLDDNSSGPKGRCQFVQNDQYRCDFFAV